MRALTKAELPALIKLAPEFLDEFFGWRTTCDADRMMGFWTSLYDTDLGIAFGMWEGEQLVGAIGGFLYRDMYDGVPTVADLGWFVKKEARRGLQPILLLRMLERWAIEHEAQRMTFTKILNPAEPVQVDELKGLGYAPRQVVFGKHL